MIVNPKWVGLSKLVCQKTRPLPIGFPRFLPTVQSGTRSNRAALPRAMGGGGGLGEEGTRSSSSSRRPASALVSHVRTAPSFLSPWVSVVASQPWDLDHGRGFREKSTVRLVRSSFLMDVGLRRWDDQRT